MPNQTEIKTRHYHSVLCDASLTKWKGLREDHNKIQSRDKIPNRSHSSGTEFPKILINFKGLST